ncbi:hypothetical protein BGZ99_003271, partial [Dissophora globulifera]
MAEDHLKLFCLVSGDPISRAFPLSIPSTESVGHLRDLTKAKNTLEFDDLAADNLTLYYVSIQDDDDDDLPILLDTLSEKTKLRPTKELSDMFKEG